MGRSGTRGAAQALLGLMLLVAGAGCGRPMQVTVAGRPAMNGGHAASVFVYQLTGDASFRQTPVEAFWRDDEAALGGQLLAGGRREVLLYPGQAQTLEVDLLDDVRFVGFAADLREAEGDAWRDVRPAEALSGGTVVVTVERQGIRVRID